ncbi:MAG TPA: hypothetical protein VEY71_01810, partial [Chitinophagales bacterium]|nr:hypothetical protein [Chitinophagales bacterium]
DEIMLVELLAAYNVDSDSTGERYYNATVFYPADSSFKIINLFREYSGATYTSVAQSIVLTGNRLIPTGIDGEVFRIDKLGDNRYLLYIDRNFKMLSTILFYELSFAGDLIIHTPTERHGNYIFDLIETKKETYKQLPKRLDFSKRFTPDVISALRLDTTTVGSDEYYFLTDQQFLRTELEHFDFVIYYKHTYGDELKKVLRVFGADRQTVITEVVLAMDGGDSDHYTLSSEFVNDSVFTQTWVYQQTSRDEERLMAYDIDYEITTFHFNEHMEFTAVSADSSHFYLEDTIIGNRQIPIRALRYGTPFRMNNVPCYWKHSVERLLDDSGKTVGAAQVRKTLLDAQTQDVLLDHIDLSANETVFGRENLTALSDIGSNDFVDVNFDGYKDYTTYSFVNSGSGGAFTESFIFDPKTKTFRYDEALSGGNMNVDSTSRSVSFTWKMGFGIYVGNTIYFDNKGNVRYTENTSREIIPGDTIDRVVNGYEKFIKGKRVEFRVDTAVWDGY